MRWRHLHRLLRLAVIALLAIHVVPEALAAFPVCGADFAPAKSAVRYTPDVAQAVLRHSHDVKVAHACETTTPSRQEVAQFARTAPSNSVTVLPTVAHPAVAFADRGPSPRGSPAYSSAYLAQRSSVLLLI